MNYGDVKIYSDSRLVHGYSLENDKDGAIPVDKETFDRWRRVEDEYDAYQRELQQLLESHPECEL